MLEEKLKSYQSLIEEVKELPESKIYHNSTPVINNLNVWNVLKAAIISNLNILLIGERGEGKTQLQNEVKSLLFGDRATYIRMRDNLKIKDLYEVYNLRKLFDKQGTVLEAKEKIRTVENPLTIIDEINRAHEKIQNQVFDIYDGYIVFEGPDGPEKISLGIKLDENSYYHSAIASANIGNYAGISPIDSALLDRSHLILDIDNFTPTTRDFAEIISETTTPKIIAVKPEDHIQKIISIHSKVKDIKLTFDALLALSYLRKGFDYCAHPENPTHSKSPVLSSIPDICEGCNALGEGCGFIYPLPIRSVKAITLLAKGLKVVSDSKAEKISKLRIDYHDILSAFCLVGPYSEILDQHWVDKEFLGNQQVAITNIVNMISSQLHNNAQMLHKAFKEAAAGELNSTTMSMFKDRWSWYPELLSEFNQAAKKYGNLTNLSEDVKQSALEEFPLLKWLE